jgi:hypothetical protein
MVSSGQSGAADSSPVTERQAPEDRFERSLIQARAGGARVPDFFIVGHAKCGTTAMHRMLSQHPQIYMPSIKEPEFLSGAAPGQATPAGAGAGRRPQTLEAYLALFAPAGIGQCAGEASPQYIRSPAAARRVAALSPDARIIAIFREPASFLRSFHLQLLEAGIETERDFALALAVEGERRCGRTSRSR